MQQRLNYNPKADGNDGLFWMAFEDFVQYYRNLYVCRLFKTVADGGVWNLYKVESAWSISAGTAGGCPNEAT